MYILQQYFEERSKSKVKDYLVLITIADEHWSIYSDAGFSVERATELIS